MKPTLLLMLALLGAPTFVTLLPAPSAAEEATTATLQLRIRGMVSKACPVLVKTAVGKMKGVTRVDASYEKKSATVQYDPRATTPAAIQRVIKDQVGFDSDVVK